VRLIRLTADAIDKILTEGSHRPLLAPGALTLGSFDGVHLGHQRLLRLVTGARDRLGLETAAVFTFVQSPRQVLQPSDEPFELTTWRAKLAALRAAGCETLIAADFVPALARLGYRDFVRAVLVEHFGMRHFVAGYDVHLGADRGGNAQTLGALGGELGYGMEVCEPVRLEGEIVSSSAIRGAVREGDLRRAARLLGRPYSMWGVVEPGDSRGHTLGYPTANVVPLTVTKLLPATGVYAVRAHVPGDVAPPGTPGVLGRSEDGLPEVDHDGQMVGAAPEDWAVFGGMLNFGHVPTFHGDGLTVPRVEANLFDFEGELQGRTVKVEWLERLRSEQRFDGRDALVAQLQRDAVAAREVLARQAP
jgi:riboflavin kinase/FMN adenylyltransferase